MPFGQMKNSPGKKGPFIMLTSKNFNFVVDGFFVFFRIKVKIFSLFIQSIFIYG